MPSGDAHAKVILFGEYAVLSGISGYALALRDFKLHITVPIKACETENLQELLRVSVIESNIPVGSGLGSSAALSVALSRAICKDRNDLNLIFEKAKFYEDYFHSGSSGIDVFTSLHGGLCKLHSKTKFEKLTPELFNHLKQFKYSVIGTLEERKVSEVKSKIIAQDFNEFLIEASIISNEFTHKLYNKTLDLHGMISLFNRSQKALKRLKVSTSLIDDICMRIEGLNHPVGVKITGAGGGGCLLVVHDVTLSEQIIMNCLNLYNDNLKLYYDVSFLE